MAMVLLTVIIIAGAAVFAGWQIGWPSAVFGTRKPGSASPPPSRSAVSQTSAAPATSSASSPQQEAADSLATLLGQSISDRSTVNDAYNDVMQCGPNLNQDVQTFQDAVTSRQRLMSQLTDLPSQAALPQAMLQDLSGAWQASAQADGDYAEWAQDQVSGGCTVNSTSDPNYAAANDPNIQATTDKTAFTSLWNPLAAQYGLTEYQQNNL